MRKCGGNHPSEVTLRYPTGQAHGARGFNKQKIGSKMAF